MIKTVVASAILLFSFPAFSFAQSRKVAGKVTAATDGLPLPGVTVSVKGSSKARTQTDINGQFRLIISEMDTALLFRYIGYMTKETVIVSDSMHVQLEEDQTQLSEIVVIGYGTQIRRDLTGSISKVSAQSFQGLPLTSFQTALQGRAAGVFINSGSGKLGQAPQVRVRGISSISAGSDPLYVIDGIPVVSGRLGSYVEADNPLIALSPDDIESIEVLKDAAAAAIYGSRASNGVVLVTTKKGRSGRTSVDFRMQFGSSSPTRKRKFLNADQYRALMEESFANVNYWDVYSSASEMWSDNTGTDDWDDHYNTVWAEESFQAGSVQQYYLGINGGDDKTRFLISGNSNQTEGILVGNSLERIGGRLSLDHTVSSVFDIGGNINLIQMNLERLPSDNAFSNPMQLNALPPIHSLYDEHGKYNTKTIYYNNLIQLTDAKNNSATFKTLTTVFANVNITPEITFRSEYGLDFTSLEEEQYLGRKTQEGSPRGTGFSNHVRSINFSNNNTLRWTKTLFDQHSVRFLAGMSYQKGTFKNASVRGMGFPADSFKKIQSAATITAGTSNETSFSFLSYLTRLSYKYADKYLLGASVRVDGSSRFGSDNRYGTFPSVSLGWIASEEGFLRNQKWLSFLKLRGSYGLTGNAEIGNFPSLTLYGSTSYNGDSGIIPVTLGDAALTWENTLSADAALEFGLFDDRISGIVDLYYKKTKDLLLNVPVAATSGFTHVTQNVGDMQNNGVELSLISRNVDRVFDWTTTANISFNRNRITRLAGQPIYPGGQYIGRVSEGEPYGYFFSRAYAGVDPSNGDALYYIDENRNTTTNDYTAAKNQKIGDPNPDLFGGLGNQFTYKGFDLNIQAQFVYGNDVYNAAGGFMSANGSWFDNQTVDQLKRWRQPGDLTAVPQARFGLSNGAAPSSRYVQDGSYLRIKSVVLGYLLPERWATKIKAAKVQVYLSAVNLLTVTGYTGYDPEVNATFAGRVQLGNDYYTPPQARTVSFGLNVGF